MRRSLAPALSLLFGLRTSALAADPAMSWQALPTRLLVSLEESLSAQQKKLIYSGFSTFSHLEIHSRDSVGRSTLLYIAECTLKYDLWEDRFSLDQLDDPLANQSIKDFKDYAARCLRAELSSASSLQRLALADAQLDIRLNMAQVSTTFAADVRRWLIEQQSGVMRGLFSHMLGELKLNESVQFKLRPPPNQPLNLPPAKAEEKHGS